MKNKLGLLAAFAAGAFACMLGLSGPASAQSGGAQPTKDLVQRGDAKCTRCHDENDEPPVLGIGKTRHGVMADARTPTCTSCHGESDAHADKPRAAKPERTFKRNDQHTSAQAKSEGCLSCHQGGKQIHWQGSAHDRTRVSCSDCHQVHAAKDQVLVQQTQASVCFTCHKDTRAAIMRFSSHPLRTGQMSCSACHQPHGSVGEHQLIRQSVNDTCYTCHADKRGPFIWEHPPSRENCGECHSPHGSNVAPLLKARGPYLCQQCHINAQHPSTAYTGNNLPTFPGAPGSPARQPVFPGGGFAGDKMLGQNCMNCHPKVHGSNHPSGARFTR
jgi:DmsE family decaheme c-type cytochrome